MSTTYLGSINKALHELFEADERVYLLGEDILDPYGGAFKVSRGLSDKFADRVITTPISEAGITGIGAGMALRGLRPIVELMFGDFITLSTDQIVNHISKFRQMYNNQVTVPIVIRTPMGGGRGYGPTHSQCIEKLYLGIPGIKVVAPSHFHDAGELLKKEVQSDDPTIFIEHKLLYPCRCILHNDDDLSIDTIDDKLGYPVAVVKNFTSGKADAVIITYGGTSQLVEDLLRSMRAEEINLVACFPSLISAVPVSVVSGVVRSCGKVILIEEGTSLFGWSAEIAAQLYEHTGKFLNKPIKRIYSHDSVIPAAKHLENKILPDKDEIEQAIEEMLL
jgi:acetoin:2,6-dichlorophenolindophenol oxidoreductase subunit beta